LKTANLLDLVIVVLYMLAMVSIGFVFMRFNKGASDYFKGGNRIPWLVAALSCFMSGFSAWTFTGAAGIAYRDGIVIVLLYVGNALAFLLGYFVFAQRWRRTRISTPMAYLVERFDETTRQTFSVASIFFQIFMGASILYGLGLMVASTFGFSIVGTILASGGLVFLYCMLGGLWAVVVADFLQAVILMPFCLVLVGAALLRVGGLGNLYHALPPQMVSFHLQGQYSWTYVSVDTERSARKVAVLCFFFFIVGAFLWFIPPMTMRVLYPDLGKVLPRFANPHEAAFAAASLTLLPNGLIGIMLAAMFSSAMANLSGMFNMHAGILAKDVYQPLFAPHASDRTMLRVGRLATAGVAVSVTILAVLLAISGKSIFSVMVTFNTILSLAYGPPAMLGLVIKKTPHWSGMASFATGLTIGAAGTFLLGWGLVMNVVVVVPAAIGVFLASCWFDRPQTAQAQRRDHLFLRLATPIDVARELAETVDQTTRVFRFLSRATAAVGLLSLLLLFTVSNADRGVVIAYSGITLMVAFALSFIRGEKPQNPLDAGQAVDQP
jgi:Na+/proline symporter